MKKQPELSELSLEELQKKIKTIKIANAFLIASIVIQFCAGFYLTIKKGFSPFLVLPVAFLPLVILNVTNYKKIKEEIAKRNV
jgi:Na+-transporting methylmalonyl-CoA/oxaloacetate decarboxylase beta subunit